MVKPIKFDEMEANALLSLKSVGPAVLKRFEEIGISSLEQLANYTAEEIAEKVASMLNTTCWKNSPQARNAVNAAINFAKASADGIT